MERKNAADALTRVSSVHPGFGVQLSIWAVQKANPSGSASRFRKSRYCCRTKAVVSSLALEGNGVAASVIVTVAVDGSPKVAPAPFTFDSATVNVSGPSR